MCESAKQTFENRIAQNEETEKILTKTKLYWTITQYQSIYMAKML